MNLLLSKVGTRGYHGNNMTSKKSLYFSFKHVQFKNELGDPNIFKIEL